MQSMAQGVWRFRGVRCWTDLLTNRPLTATVRDTTQLSTAVAAGYDGVEIDAGELPVLSDIRL